MKRRFTTARGEMPFLDHLEELRWRLIWSAIAVTLGSCVGFAAVHYLGVMELLIAPVRPLLGESESLKYFSPVDPFFITVKLGVIVGVILAFPVLVYQVWAFLSPALDKDEKRAIIPSLYFGLVLFAAGVLLAYYAVLPLSLVFLTGFQQEYLEQAIEVGKYLGFVTKLLVGFGLVFELPVVIIILSALGLVTPDGLRKNRRFAILGITILASLLTPGDIISTFLMMIPMMFLYEVSILLSRTIHRKREARLEASLEPPEGAVESGP
ncbi:MAG: twin-arginine translocase subunit TatC [Gemmatimonadota bacterium]